jgi:hypothetical protein
LRWHIRPVEQLIDRIAQPNRLAPPPIPEDVRVSLLSEYQDDILRLGDLLRRDLTHWCNPVAVAAGHKR